MKVENIGVRKKVEELVLFIVVLRDVENESFVSNIRKVFCFSNVGILEKNMKSVIIDLEKEESFVVFGIFLGMVVSFFVEKCLNVEGFLSFVVVKVVEKSVDKGLGEIFMDFIE